MTLVTNSLASTDVPWAYFAYWRHVHEMLRAGVHIAELSPTLIARRRRQDVSSHMEDRQTVLAGEPLAFLRLHMKSAIIDDRQVFLGSMNLDQRSAKLNTELGLIVDSAELAQQIDRFVEAPKYYRVRADAASDVEWIEDLGRGLYASQKK